jgi:hypothetical protein
MSPKSHPHKRCGTLKKKSFSARKYAEIHIQKLFSDNKNSIWKILGLKIQMVETCSSAPSIRRNFYFFIFDKYLNLNFWWNFKASLLGRFYQIRPVLGSFGQILLH